MTDTDTLFRTIRDTDRNTRHPNLRLPPENLILRDPRTRIDFVNFPITQGAIETLAILFDNELQNYRTAGAININPHNPFDHNTHSPTETRLAAAIRQAAERERFR